MSDVRFADIEPALQDTQRLQWVLPIIDGADDRVANQRTAALAIGLQRGLRGIPLVDYAMTLDKAWAV